MEIKIRRKRNKYSRPCDGCSRRRVRCEEVRPCFRCKEQDILCTDLRGRKKPGPKININFEESIHEDTKDKSTLITYEQLIPYLKVYKSWFYGVWPVISLESLAELILECVSDTNVEKDYTSYVLGCTLCAAISQRMGLVTTYSEIKIPQDVHPSHFAQEAVRIRHLQNHREIPCVDTLLACFFLYCYYGVSDGGILSAISYLREAISIAQVLRLHDTDTYEGLDSDEKHRMSKIYYLLLITERYICIEDKLPIILDASIPYPTLANEEQPDTLEGFIELVKVYSCPSRRFFENVSKNINDCSQMNLLGQLLLGSGDLFSAENIIKIQSHLQKVNIKSNMSEIQKANILLSQNWMKSLTWRIAENQLLITDDNMYDSLSLKFPIRIAKEFLNSASQLPLFAFEANGRGVSLKLLDIADSVSMCYSGSSKYNDAYDMGSALEVLESIFKFVKNIRSNAPLSNGLFHKIENILESRSLAASKRYATLAPEDLTEHDIELDSQRLILDDESSNGNIQFMNSIYSDNNSNSGFDLIEFEKPSNSDTLMHRSESKETSKHSYFQNLKSLENSPSADKNTPCSISWLCE